MKSNKPANVPRTKKLRTRASGRYIEELIREMTPVICLGTAQFGLAYGITNKSGKTKESEVAKILKEAKAKNITFLDTAQAYGDAEAILGRNIGYPNNYRIISKLPKQNDKVFTAKNRDAWEKNIHKHKTWNKKTRFIYSSSEELEKRFFIFDKLAKRIKERGLVERIGISLRIKRTQEYRYGNN